MKRVKTADIWVSDVYLQRGLETLLDKSFSAPARKRFVFFTIENYYAVKAQNYDLSTHRLVLLTQGDMYYFLSDFKMFRLNARSDLSTLQRSIKDIAADGEKVRKRTEKIVLTDRDKVLYQSRQLLYNAEKRCIQTMGGFSIVTGWFLAPPINNIYHDI